METALDVLPIGFILLDSESQIVYTNKSAAVFLAEKDGLQVTATGLQAEQTSGIDPAGSSY